ncbi:biopolymer transporter ExbD [Defluviimonas sp. WL0002]|uniref:Biopolymer transporter ExbD n=1 Tax=Albidovulum marisflavi TaxID=2984159 RepID=A0ABT2ZDL2_9RHOB|nr:biopolymer transporter ExbD [Defluviimonas sp. WL0002]MCV2869209.1 biopolymer transporter ExbD [Defluviimonas sp. WL0002]
MELRRRSQERRLISLVPMIDVMLILLVFFMVTSSYLDLDMVPMLERQDETATAPSVGGGDGGGPLFVRIGADGTLRVGARSLDRAGFGALLAERLLRDPGLQVLILPSGHAPTQALVSVMDLATGVGVQRLRIVRLQGAP